MPVKPFRLAVRAVINDGQGRYLLLRRSNCRHFVGQWEWPGGKVDDGETFDVACIREVREETGLQVELTGVVGAAGMEVADVNVAVLCLEARLTGGDLRLSDEHDESAWVAAADLPGWNLTDAIRPMAAALAARSGAKGAG